jgi:hypothetical protein
MRQIYWMLRVLVTGFNPWAGATYNPSGEVARQLHGRTLSGAEFGYPHKGKVRGLVLDVEPEAKDKSKRKRGNEDVREELFCRRPSMMRAVPRAEASSLESSSSSDRRRND